MHPFGDKLHSALLSPYCRGHLCRTSSCSTRDPRTIIWVFWSTFQRRIFQVKSRPPCLSHDLLCQGKEHPQLICNDHVPMFLKIYLPFSDPRDAGVDPSQAMSSLMWHYTSRCWRTVCYINNDARMMFNDSSTSVLCRLTILLECTIGCSVYISCPNNAAA